MVSSGYDGEVGVYKVEGLGVFRVSQSECTFGRGVVVVTQQVRGAPLPSSYTLFIHAAEKQELNHRVAIDIYRIYLVVNGGVSGDANPAIKLGSQLRCCSKQRTCKSRRHQNSWVCNAERRKK